MIKVQEFNSAVPFFGQLGLQDSTGPVYLVFVFNVPADCEAQFLACWKNHGAVMGRFDGYGSEKLHRGLAHSQVYINYARWQSLAHFGAAFASPESQACLAAYPEACTFTGQVLSPVAVEGVCSAD